tara:strand:- start:9353 stop:9628 length:276 start_codon:yes stop_codon:yes gene_type:complete
MEKEIVDTNFSINLRTLIAIGSVVILMVGEYIVLQEDINEAREMPEPEITKLEFEYGIEKLQKSIELNLKEIEELKDEVMFIEANYQKHKD